MMRGQRDPGDRAGGARWTGRLDPATLGYATLRLGIGMSMLIHGLNRIGHIPAFAQTLAGTFSKTSMPTVAVIAFAYVTPPVELLIGALVLPGLFTRLGLAAGGLWMVALIFGSTLRESYDVVGIQLIYSMIFFELLRLESLNEVSIDRIFRAHPTARRATARTP